MSEPALAPEQPLIEPRPPSGRFTTGNARYYSQKAAQARKENAAHRDALPATEPPTPANNQFLHARIGQVEQEITRQHELLSKAKDPKDVKDLAMAIDRLYQTWSLLTGHERPGVRKAKRAGREPSPAIAVLPKEIDTP